MTNIRFSSIDQYLDVASINVYHTFFKHQPEEKRMRRIHNASRDSARTPMQWTGGEHAGFSASEPWFPVNPNYPGINVEAEERDPDSILNFYRKCLKLRKENETLLFGSYREYQAWSGKRFLYERRFKGETILVLCSFSREPQTFRLPRGFVPGQAELILCNYPEGSKIGTLRPYEAQLLRWKRP